MSGSGVSQKSEDIVCLEKKLIPPNEIGFLPVYVRENPKRQRNKRKVFRVFIIIY